MSGAPPQNLEELFEALGSARKLSERLRVLAHAWPLLRSLTPKQREQVGLRVGSRWAWNRLEKTFLRDGELSDNEQLVGRIFERMGESDPEELRSLAAAARSGDHDDVKDMLMIELREALEEEADQEEEALRESATAEASSPAPEPALEARVESKLVDSVDEVLASARAQVVEAPAPVEPEAPAAAPSSKLPRVPPIPVLPAEPLAESAQPASRDPSPAPASDTSDLDELVAADGVERMRILRSLQRQARPAADLGGRGRARLIASLGGGWASRRALSRMISARSVAGLEEALELIAGLARPGQQTWCLADLIEHWELDGDALGHVLEAAPSDAARRRLARRAALRERTTDAQSAGSARPIDPS